jgi:Spy/CpxP family protein refolding chaperone
MNILRPLSAAVLAAALAFPAFAQAPATGADGAATPTAHFGHGHRHHRNMGAFFHALKQLDLSADQKAQIKQDMHASFAALKPQMAGLRQAHYAFDTAVPGTPAFTSAESSLEQAETTAAGAHLQSEANLRTQIYGVLNDAQKAQLANLLAQAPQPGSHWHNKSS